MNSDKHRPHSRSGSPSERDDRLRELGTVTGELLHDLGGVLSVLSARVALATEEATLGRIPAEELVRIQRDADELGRMVREIIEELGGARRSPEVTFPLVSTVEEEVERWLVRAPSVNVVLESSIADEAEVAGPRSFFSRAVGNLLRNAARYARKEVRVTIEGSEDGRVGEIRVEDDGDGIADQIRQGLFEPFTSDEHEPSDRGGTGLGLSFAHWGIRRLDGELIADESPSRLGGASFRIVVPLWSGARGRYADSSARAHGASAVGEARPRYGRGSGELDGVRVVVVEDDPGVRRVFTRLLRRSGAEVEGLDPAPWTAVDDGVSSLREYRPDVILLDLNLEVMSGLDLYARLRKVEPDLASRVLFLTGGSAPAEPLDRPLVNKMIVWDELVASVHRVAFRTD